MNCSLPAALAVGNTRLQVTVEERRKASDAFGSFSPKILEILLSYLKARTNTDGFSRLVAVQSTGDNRTLQNKVFECFLSWVRQGLRASNPCWSSKP